jgi:hypothetical protein
VDICQIYVLKWLLSLFDSLAVLFLRREHEVTVTRGRPRGLQNKTKKTRSKKTIQAKYNRPILFGFWRVNPFAFGTFLGKMLKIDLESLTDDCGSYSTIFFFFETFLLSRRFEIPGLRPRISYRKRLNSAHKARYDPFYLPYASGI